MEIIGSMPAREVHFYLSKCFIYQLMHKSFALKEILKFTLKCSDMFRFNHHHQGAYYLSFAKVTVTVTLAKLK